MHHHSEVPTCRRDSILRIRASWLCSNPPASASKSLKLVSDSFNYQRGIHKQSILSQQRSLRPQIPHVSIATTITTIAKTTWNKNAPRLKPQSLERSWRRRCQELVFVGIIDVKLLDKCFCKDVSSWNIQNLLRFTSCSVGWFRITEKYS